MKACPQTETQSVYQHGISVRDHMFQLINMLRNNQPQDGWRLPDWLFQYRGQILKNLLSDSIIEEYTTYHDCGKPYCLTYDAEGKKHFPNHAQTSYLTWLNVGGSETAAKLMQMDMMIHTIKANELDDFIKHPEAITLLLAGLAEVHSNSRMFGGCDSTSFKIKWNQINKRGKAICQKLFRSDNVSID
jgi:hypothetical protein